MIILTDCLTETIDEGCIKIANSLAKRLKKNNNNTKIISCGKQSLEADFNIHTNKIFLNKSLFKILNSEESNLIYIPFASNTLASIIRSIVLDICGKNDVYSLFALRQHMSKLSLFLLKNSKFKVIALSKKSYDYFYQRIGDRALYLKTGIDLEKFKVVDEKTKANLRKKHGFDTDKTIVLHVGHLHNGRNIGCFLDVDKNKEIIIVVSSVSKQDSNLRKKLESNKNIHIIDKYIPNIEEIYSLADVYVFPVVKEKNSIDIPLSVLEAASCGLPVVSTKYGELNEFIGRSGFLFLDMIEKNTLNSAINKAIKEKHYSRDSIVEYDWKNSISFIEEKIGDRKK